MGILGYIFGNDLFASQEQIQRSRERMENFYFNKEKRRFEIKPEVLAARRDECMRTCAELIKTKGLEEVSPGMFRLKR